VLNLVGEQQWSLRRDQDSEPRGGTAQHVDDGADLLDEMLCVVDQQERTVNCRRGGSDRIPCSAVDTQG
jgi:hypothetical protein